VEACLATALDELFGRTYLQLAAAVSIVVLRENMALFGTASWAASYEAVPNGYFASSFVHQASDKICFQLILRRRSRKS